MRCWYNFTKGLRNCGWNVHRPNSSAKNIGHWTVRLACRCTGLSTAVPSPLLPGWQPPPPPAPMAGAKPPTAGAATTAPPPTAGWIAATLLIPPTAGNGACADDPANGRERCMPPTTGWKRREISRDKGRGWGQAKPPHLSNSQSRGTYIYI